ncbi:MAG: hypothetical protein JNL82_25030 [Myxococcales bacterium]|nr:hypothetical protein [Myxococcales bacterium]
MFIGERSSKLALFVTLCLCACGEEAAAVAPAPTPAPEFDDPFAEEAVEVAAAAAPAPAVAESAAVAGTPEAATVAGSPASPAVAESAAVAGTPESAAVAGTPAPADSNASATAGAARRKSKPGAAPVPQDIPPAPAPAPTPEEPKAPEVTTPTPSPAPAPAPAPAPTVAPGPERFAGSFSYVGGQAQRDQMAAAIEATVMALNVMFRSIARKRITEGNPLREQVTIAVAGKAVTVSFGADRRVSGALDGPGVAWTDEAGSPLTVTFSQVKGRIVMFCQGKGGARRNVFTLDDAGDKLTMSVTMSSDRLPVPVKYALTYRRK